MALENYIGNVAKIVSILGKEKDIIDESHYRSVVCGAIYFWVKLVNLNVSLNQITETGHISSLTVKNKFFDIKRAILRLFFRKILNRVLTVANNECAVIRDPRFDVFVNEDELKIVNKRGQDLPIDNLKDLSEWNFFLNNTYNSGKIPILIGVNDRKRELFSTDFFDKTYGISAIDLIFSPVKKLFSE